jgi:hypothetical protein
MKSHPDADWAARKGQTDGRCQSVAATSENSFADLEGRLRHTNMSSRDVPVADQSDYAKSLATLLTNSFTQSFRPLQHSPRGAFFPTIGSQT